MRPRAVLRQGAHLGRLIERPQKGKKQERMGVLAYEHCIGDKSGSIDTYLSSAVNTF